MIDQNWCIIIPPDGAARTVALRIADTAVQIMGGSRVKTFDSQKTIRAFESMLKQPDQTMSVDLFNQFITVSALDFGCTRFLVPALSPVTLFTLNLLRKQHVKTMHWFYEDFRRVEYWRSVLTGYDYFFAVQKGPIPEACTQAGAQYHFLPTALVSQPAHEGNARVFDIVFIGVYSEYRRQILEILIAKGYKMAIAGLGWDKCSTELTSSVVKSTWIDETDSAVLMGKAKIGLNLSHDNPEPDRGNMQVSPRVYDIMAARCVLLSENIPLLQESIGGCDTFTFNTTAELQKRVDFILGNYVQLGSMIEKNHSVVLKDHTYHQRFKAILDIVE